jgi:oxygen-independent coproporphyrinogen-3 oxidase
VEPVMASIRKELEDRKYYLNGETVETIYFGGGTPSAVEVDNIKSIVETISKNYPLSPTPEITLEANPDDLHPSYFEKIKSIGINRLSIGVQSFFERDLKWMNRRHSVEKAVESIRFARKHGFENINIDLIYGLPGLTSEDWKYNLERFFELDIPHLSAYHLTIEPKTVFGVRKKRGQLNEISEDASVAHFEILIEEMAKRGYLHYEISNFALEGYLSKHNLSYWKNDLYLGAGPSAHSYDGNSRRWNTKLHNVYISNLANGEKYFDEEELTDQDRFNDYVLTNLRTMWGIDLATIDRNFGDFYTREVEKTAAKYKAYLTQNNGTITLNDKGKFIADRIASEFFSIENL